MSVDLVVEDPLWLDALPGLEAAARTAVTAALGFAGLDPARWSVALLACDDARIAALNGDFRDRAAPTNVLAWPAFELAPAAPGGLPRPPADPGGAGPVHLGDVAIARQTVLGETETGGPRLKCHVIHLILHSSLHLLGYDHRTEADATLMEGVETRLLAGLGIADPYGLPDAVNAPDGGLVEARADDPRQDR